MTETRELAQDMMQLEALLVARAALYEAMHMAFGGEPSRELLECLASSELSDCLDEFAQESGTLANLRAFLAGLQSRVEDAGFLETAQAEFNRFFEGPATPPAHPWESSNIGPEHMVFQPSTLDVREAYHALGLKVLREKHLPDDHLSLMCAYLAEGGRRMLAAWRRGEAEECLRLLGIQRGFLSNHVNNWLPIYAEHCLRVSKAVLYPQLAHGIRDLAAIDAVLLANLDFWLEENVLKPKSETAAVQITDLTDPPYDRGELFAAAEQLSEKIASLKLKGIEDNTLVAMA